MKKLFSILFCLIGLSSFGQTPLKTKQITADTARLKSLTVDPVLLTGYGTLFNKNDSLHFESPVKDWNLGKIVYQDSLGYYVMRSDSTTLFVTPSQLTDSLGNYLLADGTRPLTGDWAAGAYKISNTDTIQGEVIEAKSAAPKMKFFDTSGNGQFVLRLDTSLLFHNYSVSGTYRNNLFIGKNAGNRTLLSGGLMYNASKLVGIGSNVFSKVTTAYNATAMGYDAGSGLLGGAWGAYFGTGAARLNKWGQDIASFGSYNLYNYGDTLDSGDGWANHTSMGTCGYYFLKDGAMNTGLGWWHGRGGLEPDIYAISNEASVHDTLMLLVGYLATRHSSIPYTTRLYNAAAIGNYAKVGRNNAMVLGGTGVWQPNVGIGTVNPVNIFDVKNATFTDILTYEGGGVRFRSDTTGISIGGRTVYGINAGILQGSNLHTPADIIAQLYGGKFGIGITPVTKAHVYDKAADGTTINRTSIIDVLTLESANTYEAPYTGFGQGIQFRGATYLNATVRPLARIASVLSSSSADTGPAITFSTVTTSAAITNPVERARINWAGLGLETTTPTNIISLGSVRNQKIWIENTEAAAGKNLTIAAGSTTGGSNIKGGDLYLTAGIGTDATINNVYIQTPTPLNPGDGLQTLTNKVAVTGNGNIGFGIDAPVALSSLIKTLDIRSSGNSTGSGGGIRFGTSTASKGNIFTNDDDIYIGSTYGAHYFVNKGVTSVSIKNTHKVGIREENPFNVLDVKGATFTATHSDTTGARFRDVNYGISIGGYDVGTVGILQGSNHSGGTADIGVQPFGGNMALGSINPLAISAYTTTLDIRSATNYSYSGGGIRFGTSAASAGGIYSYGNNLYFSSTRGFYQFGTNGTPKLYIANSGHISNSTDTTNYNFNIAGTGNFTDSLRIPFHTYGTSWQNSHRAASEHDVRSIALTIPTVTPANVTAGSNKITFGGTPTGAALQAFSIDVDQTKIDHNSLLNYDARKHYYKQAIDSLSTALTTGLVKVTAGKLSTRPDSTLFWNQAYNYSQIGHLPLAGGTLTGDVRLNDNVKLLLGTGGGSDSQIYWNGTGLVYLSSAYHTFFDIDSHKQFETTATGVNIPAGKTYQIADKSIVSDSAYNPDWNGNHAYTASKDAIYNKINSIAPTNSVVTYTVKVQLTPTQLKSLATTPVQLVPAYADGIVNVVNVNAVLDYTSGADWWTNTGSSLNVYCDNATSIDGLFSSNSVFYQSHHDCMVTLDHTPAETSSVEYSQYVQNKAIMIKSGTNFVPTSTGTYPINVYVTYTLTTL